MQYGFNFRDVRERQQQQRVETKKQQQAYANRPRQESSLATFRALYDRDEGLKVAYVNLATAETQQFYTDTERAWSAFTASLKSAGHELSASGIKKFQDYLSHQKTDTKIIDVTRVETWVDAFNRAVQIGLFTTGDFVSDAPAKTAPLVGRAREAADRQEYIKSLRAELGEEKFQQMYGNHGNPLGARRANLPI